MLGEDIYWSGVNEYGIDLSYFEMFALFVNYKFENARNIFKRKLPENKPITKFRKNKNIRYLKKDKKEKARKFRNYFKKRHSSYSYLEKERLRNLKKREINKEISFYLRR